MILKRTLFLSRIIFPKPIRLNQVPFYFQAGSLSLGSLDPAPNWAARSAHPIWSRLAGTSSAEIEPSLGSKRLRLDSSGLVSPLDGSATTSGFSFEANPGVETSSAVQLNTSSESLPVNPFVKRSQISFFMAVCCSLMHTGPLL